CDLTEDVEVLGLFLAVLVHQVVLEFGQEVAVPRHPGDVHGRVHPKSVHTHVDVLLVGAQQVFLHGFGFGVEVGQVLVDPAAAGVLTLPVADPALVVVLLREHAGGGVGPLAVVDGLPLRAVVPGGFAPVLTCVVLGLLGGPQVTVVVGDARFGFHGQPVVGEVGVGVVVVVLPLLVLYSEEGGGLQADGAPSGAVVEDDVLVDLHVTVVCCVDECLAVGAPRFQAWVDPVEVVPVVAVKVVVGAVQDHG